jgi:hypothetical protein
MNLIENAGKHLHGAISTTSCGKHSVEEGVPCYTLPNNSGLSTNPFHYGICGVRIRKAGFVGKISPESMRRKAPYKKDGERKPFTKKPNSRPKSFNSTK